MDGERVDGEGGGGLHGGAECALGVAIHCTCGIEKFETQPWGRR